MEQTRRKIPWGRLRRLVTGVLPLVAVAIDLHGNPTQYFSYFTVLTNLGIGAWFLLAAWKPSRLESASVVRLTLTVSGWVTLAVYWILLSPIHHPQGWNFAANLVLHLIVPLAMAAEDLWFPWPPLKASRLGWGFVFPVVWVVFTLVRGAQSGWYPYYFLDAAKLGSVTLLAVFLVLLFAGFAALALVWRLLIHRRHRKATEK